MELTAVIRAHEALKRPTTVHVPIAYTHLDVYKRQGPDLVDPLPQLAVAGLDGLRKPQIGLRVLAVSYTHLDVYKRQMYRRSM